MVSQRKRDKQLRLYKTMRLVRIVETQLSKLFADSEVPGFIHLSIGQEAISSGVMTALDERDTMATNHRGHGHVIARGLDLERFFMEIMGKAGGICGGRGGSMHVADMELGILGANGIVGAGIPIAMGSALAHQVRGTGGVAVVFFGDGAMAEGVLHESLNMASLWKLPMVFVCENNGWSEFSPTKDQFAAALSDLAAAFKIPHTLVDGNDVWEVSQAAESLVKEARNNGPQVLECKTFRVRGHYEGDPQKYRPEDEINSLSDIDPLARAERSLIEQGVSQDELNAVMSDIDQRVAAAVEVARADDLPEFSAALSDVYTLKVKG
ncbi:ABC transporter substrate-binding protein [Pollutimonas nitritireducens]|uniref:ABC transporter substrate-binding protein n=1 Tax=Pollutimonas nitritireducens TaxID=2045209 RepID=A0A2N4UB78_9BURK|nr:thiamine pyrophosphate-dependent dehydrogenase E1 component subunit alpha [Pollutimonas nitritireducens]PLC52267.1 ABC transporter substrate-binding protein [Pollutimonas nitritireducens]